MKLSLRSLPEDAIDVSAFGGEDGGVVLLDAAFQVDTVLRHVIDRYIAGAPSSLRHSYGPFAERRPDRTHIREVYSRRLQSQAAMDRPKDIRYFSV
jgi:hypothetical protein